LLKKGLGCARADFWSGLYHLNAQRRTEVQGQAEVRKKIVRLHDQSQEKPNKNRRIQSITEQYMLFVSEM
jgi:hypothetical protein